MLNLLRRLLRNRGLLRKGLRCDPFCDHCKKWRGPGVIANVWSSTTMKAIEFSSLLGSLISKEGRLPALSQGTVIRIPSLKIKKRKPVHKAPQFPCNFHHRPDTEGKPAFKSTRNWAKVTCGNCLRSSLKKQYDKRSFAKHYSPQVITKRYRTQQPLKKQVADMLGKAMAESGLEDDS